MEKLDLHTPDFVSENIEKLASLFPHCVTESAEGKKIDFDLLQQELSDDIVEGNRERYRLEWPGKREAIVTANLPTTKTLRPIREDSVDFDNTENLYIEGDNLEVLKLLQESYFGKIKMIYIDPPYNTGNDFVYKDNFSMVNGEWSIVNSEKDEYGTRLVANPESSGRYHSDWLTMMYPRLKLARNLLTDDGVIFISIDDNEVHNLRKICDEVFGEGNFIAEFIWKGGRRNAAKYISISHEYMLSYVKSIPVCNDKEISWHEKKKGLDDIYKNANKFLKDCNNNFLESSQLLKEWYKSLSDDNESKAHSHYCWIDSNGIYFASDISRGGGGGPKWDIKNPQTGEVVSTPERGWAYSSKEELENDIRNNKIHFNGNGVPCKKRYLKDNESQLKETVFYKDRRGSSKRLRSLMEADFFPFPKDEEILKEFLDSFSNKDSIILDFFSGSATTAHAVMKLNAEDGGNRKFIMVQLPELTDKNSEAFKAGYKNICEIGKERIRRAAKLIVNGKWSMLNEKKEKLEKMVNGKLVFVNDKFIFPEGIIIDETAETLLQEINDLQLTINNFDTGFRVYRLDTSNMQDVYYRPQDYKQDALDLFADNIKPDRTADDLLAQVMLDWGLPLSYKIEQATINGKQVFRVAQDSLLACFDKGIDEDFAKIIAKEKPLRIVFRDSGFANDTAKINVQQLLKQLSPETEMKVI